jgi:hypothetical protein
MRRVCHTKCEQESGEVYLTMPRRTLASIIEQAGMTVEEFIRLL